MKTTIKYKECDSKLQQKISQASIIPRPIAWITSLNENGSVNLAPFSYFALLSPSLMAVSFTKLEDTYKDTYLNIKREKDAVINIASTDMLELLDMSSETLEYNESEVEDLNLNVTPSTLIKTPYLNEAYINFEVILLEDLEFMDIQRDYHENNVMFLRIVAVHLSDEVYDSKKQYIKQDVLNPLSRLAGANYGKSEVLDYTRKF